MRCNFRPSQSLVIVQRLVGVAQASCLVCYLPLLLGEYAALEKDSMAEQCLLQQEKGCTNLNVSTNSKVVLTMASQAGLFIFLALVPFFSYLAKDIEWFLDRLFLEWSFGPHPESWQQLGRSNSWVST
jgi:hypothetical protein